MAAIRSICPLCNRPAKDYGHPGDHSFAGNEPACAPPDLQIRRTIRRDELRQIVPLSDSTIYRLEEQGQFPKRFNLTPCCVVWDLQEVMEWVEARRVASVQIQKTPAPDVRKRKYRPVKEVAAAA
ncbi:helix-turn-helix transcriptional regulator [Cupriavidus basilensis]